MNCYIFTIFLFNFANDLSKLKHYVNTIVWTLIGVYTMLVVLSHVPTIQHYMGSQIEEILSQTLETKVSIKRVDAGFLNRIILDNVEIHDQNNKPLLEIRRIGAKLDLLNLFQKKITINSAQLFGCNIHISQDSAQAPTNIQFLIDKLSSGNKKSQAPFNLQINSLIIRNSHLCYDRKDVATSSISKFSPEHININHISAHIIINNFKNGNLNLQIKRLAFDEQSGFHVKSMSAKIEQNAQALNINNLHIELPHSTIRMPQTTISYRLKKGKIDKNSIQFKGKIKETKITPCDLAPFVQKLRKINQTFNVYADFLGNNSEIKIPNIAISSPESILSLLAKSTFSIHKDKIFWNAGIQELKLNGQSINFFNNNFQELLSLPSELTRLGNICINATASGSPTLFEINANIKTEAGNSTLTLRERNHLFKGEIFTPSFNIGKILDNNHLGIMAAKISISGELDKQNNKSSNIGVQGKISKFEYNSYVYKDIDIDGDYQNNRFEGTLAINDPNARIALHGNMNISEKVPLGDITLNVENFNPSALHLTDIWPNSIFSFKAIANIKRNNPITTNAEFELSDFVMKKKFSHDQNQNSEEPKDNKHEEYYTLRKLIINSEAEKQHQKLSLHSDFGDIHITGQYDYTTLFHSITALIADKLPTLPGLPKQNYTNRKNNFTINANIHNTDWLKALFNVPLDINEPIQIDGNLHDDTRSLHLRATMPHFKYDGDQYEKLVVNIATPGDTLRSTAHIEKKLANNKNLIFDIASNAQDNHLTLTANFRSNHQNKFEGMLRADAQFFKDIEDKSTARISIQPSEFIINDTIWNVTPSQISYRENDLKIDNFAIVSNDGQHLLINGHGTKDADDLIHVDLKDINVEYILNLINFHSVDFSGIASGKASVSSLFNKPEANGSITVNDFRFEGGRMGILHANATLNNIDNQIDINAIINDEDNHLTIVNGFVSPQHNTIELSIKARRTRGEFLESFCGSFMRDVDVNITGDLLLYGPLNAINLTGNATANGKLSIKQLNTTYTLNDIPIKLIPNEIILENDTIKDRNSNTAIINGAIHHRNLTQLTFDLGIDTDHFLSYDHKDFGGSTFCGTIYADGHCDIKGKNGEILFDIDVTPTIGSVFSYNATSPEAIQTQDFVQWTSYHAEDKDSTQKQASIIARRRSAQTILQDIPSDIRMNLNINANPDLTFRLLMNEETGDYIALNGDGALRATFYNKGGFDMYGNYLIDHGIYKLTIQNIIKKDFHFQQGGSVIFVGDPYNARLNLQALYTINGVSLSDLNIGRSFTTNNIRVDCLMNITGTPYSPKVDFALDMPTVGNDAKQMVLSLINSEEEMNQQVLYLLAIGRFYSQASNNSDVENNSQQQSQTSLAMQSILSGTISQQLNNVLSSVVNNSNWNFGANISTGTDGFYNAEYEGILSGRLLHNRLLINGQFGYRDNVNNPNSSSFIGDFDIRYLLFPNGNLAIKVYNQTNDRYFTKNSLNTQGVGLIMKKDFNGLKDLFGFKKNSKKINDNIKYRFQRERASSKEKVNNY